MGRSHGLPVVASTPWIGRAAPWPDRYRRPEAGG